MKESLFAPPPGRTSTNPATRVPDAFGQFGTPFYINPDIGRGRGRGGPIKTFFPPAKTDPFQLKSHRQSLGMKWSMLQATPHRRTNT